MVKRQSLENATKPKKKKTRLDKSAKKKKKSKLKLKTKSPKPAKKLSKKKKLKKKKLKDAVETPKKKKKAKNKDKKSTGKKKKKVKGKKKKKVVKEEAAAAEVEEAEPAAEEATPAPAEAQEEETAAAVPAPAAATAEDDGATVKLFVGNLSFDIDEAGIKEFFKDCGTIIDVFWLTDKEDGRFLGRGFITFENVDQARKAYAKKDQECMGRGIKLDYARPRENKGGQREARPLSERPEGCTTVFLGNLSFNIDDDAVKEFAKDCGEIKSLRWLTHRDTGDFKGCGFCEFATSEAVDKFIKLNGQRLQGRPIRIDYAQTRKSGGGGGGGNREPRPLSEKPEGCTTVFIGNVSFEIEDKNIHDLADGNVKNIRWLTDRETQEFKGCGFVEFYDTESVDKFVVNNGKEVLGRSIRIDYAKPRPPRD